LRPYPRFGETKQKITRTYHKRAYTCLNSADKNAALQSGQKLCKLRYRPKPQFFC